MQADLRSGPKSKDILGVVCDSRQVRPGYLFVALAGHEKNGLQYVDDALTRGAAVIIAEQPVKVGGETCMVTVPDARKALAELAARFFDMPSEKLQVVGITGTNGKTTTAFVARDILRAAGRATGLIGTVEYQIGSRTIPASRTTPDAAALQSMFAQMISAGCQSVVMEVSSHALEQMRVASIDFDVAVFTNLTRDHLDYHMTKERYFAAKRKLFENLGKLKKKAAAAINIDDEHGKKLLASDLPGCTKISFGFSPDAGVCAENVVTGSRQTRFTLRSPWGSREVATNLLGRFNVLNILAAVAACQALGIDFRTACDILPALSVVPGRLEEMKTGAGYQVFVDYAHTDDALQNVLTTLREFAPGRIIVVFGCGGNRDRTKRPLMGAVVSRLADFAYITSDNPRKEDPLAIIEEIKAGFEESGRYEAVPDRTEAIARALKGAKDGDIILIAGKGHETFQEFVNTTIPFDDRKVVQKIISGQN